MMNELRSIAKNMHDHRPEWDLPGILTVLARLDGDPDRIRVAAERVAMDPRAKTPAAITFSRYWNTQPAAAAVPPPLPECAHCGAPRRRVNPDGTAAPRPTGCTQCGRPWHEAGPR